MRFLIIVFLCSSFLYAHKVNLFLNNDGNKVDIYSYFSNGSPCIECSLIIKNEEKIIFNDKLNNQGKYSYLSQYSDLEITVDAGSGHIAEQSISLNINHNEDLKKHQKIEDEYFYIKVVFSFIFMGLFFYLLKRMKKND